MIAFIEPPRGDVIEKIMHGCRCKLINYYGCHCWLVQQCWGEVEYRAWKSGKGIESE